MAGRRSSLIVDVGYCIEVYADFTGTGKAYVQFPDRSGFRIMLDDLRDAAILERLARDLGGSQEP